MVLVRQWWWTRGAYCLHYFRNIMCNYVFNLQWSTVVHNAKNSIHFIYKTSYECRWTRAETNSQSRKRKETHHHTLSHTTIGNCTASLLSWMIYRNGRTQRSILISFCSIFVTKYPATVCSRRDDAERRRLWGTFVGSLGRKQEVGGDFP